MTDKLQEWIEAADEMASHGKWFSGDTAQPSEYRAKVRANAARLTELAAYLRDGGWLPIESAPKDGTRILAWGSLLGGEPCAAIVDWCDSIYGVSGQGGWLVTHDAEAYHWEGFIPTHYRPLPAPPAALAPTGGEG
jgi:hypothetical protein